MSGSGLSLSDAISGYQKGLQGHVADVKTKMEGAETDYKAKIASADSEEASLDPNALTPPKLEPAPNPKQTSPVEVWGSSAMWMAALGGLLTRRPLVNSLNAAAGVMNAYKTMDKEAADTAYDTWKTENANAVKMAQFSIESYKTALSKIETDKKGALADFTTTAKTLGDENAAYVATHYGIDAAVRYVDAQQSHLDRLKAQGPLIADKHAQIGLQLNALAAVKKLQAAKQSGDPAAIEAATKEVQDSNQQLQAFKGTGLAASAKSAKDDPLYDTANKEVDKALALINKTPTVVGAPGAVRRYSETIGGWTGVTKSAPAQAFESQIKAVQASVRNLVTKSHYMSAGAVEQIDDLVKGLGVWDTPQSAKTSLAQIKDILDEQRGRVPEDEQGGAGGGDLSSLSDDEILKALGGK